jgi:hypothetical protein
MEKAGQGIVCMSCASEFVLHEQKRKAGEIPDGTPVPIVSLAWTWAPAWQSTQVGMNQIWACVTIPVCKRHISVEEMSPLQKAQLGGQLLQGRIGG